MITQRLRLTRNGGQEHSIGVQLRYSLPSNLTEFTVQLSGDLNIDSGQGFESSGGEYTWDGDTSSPYLHGRYNPTQSVAGGVQAVDAGDWAIVSKPAGGINLNWRYRGNSPEFRQQYRVKGPGAIANDGAIAYLGPHDQYTQRSQNELIRLIIPAVANLRHSPRSILDSVTTASDRLDIGPYSDEVLMIAAPSSRSNWGPTGTQFGNEGFWSLDQAQLAHPNNTWIHEYVHTRQAYQWENSLQWLNEGTANYYAAWAGVDQGVISFERFYRAISNTPDPSAIVSDPSTWTSQQTMYTKGVVVTAALAAELQRQTNGRIQLGDVMQTLCHNAGEDTLTIADFRSALHAQPGVDLTDWVAAHIDGRDLPTPSRDAALYGFSEEVPKQSPQPRTHDSDMTTPAQPEEPESPEAPDKPEEPTPTEEPSGESVTAPDEPEREPEQPEEPTDEMPTTDADEESPPDSPIRPTAGECPVCDTAIDADDEYCDTCGTALQRECHFCGQQAPGQEYCPQCGAQLIVRCELCGHEQTATHPYCDDCGAEL